MDQTGIEKLNQIHFQYNSSWRKGITKV